ncbi:triple tyrosine motif-containing protein [Geofilum rubicundum]|nr:triple tyrosine motif-containing protein [Geofilum rubicundum]
MEASSSRMIPLVRSFEKSDYHAGRQNWDVATDEDGVIYFANTDGLLCNIFGEWTLQKLEKGGTVRALHVANDTIWVGGIQEYGYFFKNDQGSLEYKKLGDLENEIIWNIIEFENQIVFQSYLNLIFFDKATKTIHNTPFAEEFWTILEWENELWAITMQGVIGVIRDDRFYHRESFSPHLSSEVRKAFVHDSRLFIVSMDDVFVYDKNTLSRFDFWGKLDKEQFFSGGSLNKHTILLGTVTSGLLIVDMASEDISVIGTAQGLLDNTVLSVETDEDNSVWLGLDYGIAKLELKKSIYPVFANGATYHIMDVGNKTYLSTNKGAFVSENNEPFRFMEGTAGQVWRIRAIGDALYVCHNKGVFQINENHLSPAFDAVGVMDIARFGQSEYYLLSAYTGVLLARYLQGKFYIVTNLNVWGNPKLYYDAESDCIWGDTKYKPLVQFVLNTDEVEVKWHDEMERFFKTQSGLVFYNGLGLLSYESDSETFVPIEQAPFNQVAEKGISTLDIAVNNGAIAYVANDDIKLFVTLPDGTVHSYEKFISSVKNDLIKADPFLNLYNNELRIATDRGVVVFNLEYQSSAIQKKPVITSVNVGSMGTYQKFYYPFKDRTINLPEGRYNLLFQFASPYSDYEFTEFRYMLESYDKEWTEWDSQINQKEYTRISGGEYRFLLQTRVNQSVITQTELAIGIKPKWHQNLWIVLPIIILGLLVFGYVAQLIFHELKENARLNKLAYEKRLKKEAVRTKNEQLMQFLEIISHKNSFLQDLKGILTRMRNSEATRCVAKIDEELNNEKKQFLYHQLFSENNQELIVRLSKDYPALTDNDIRIITLIRTNMSSKEIAAILNISNSSFDTSRYRIRKKLGLSRDEDLNNFVRNL